MKPSQVAKEKGFDKGVFVSSPKHGYGKIVGFNGGTIENPSLKVKFDSGESFAYLNSLKLYDSKRTENIIKQDGSPNHMSSSHDEEEDILGSPQPISVKDQYQITPIKNEFVDDTKNIGQNFVTPVDIKIKQEKSKSKNEIARKSPINHFQGKKKRIRSIKSSPIRRTHSHKKTTVEPIEFNLHSKSEEEPLQNSIEESQLSQNEEEESLREIDLKPTPAKKSPISLWVFLCLFFAIVSYCILNFLK